MEKILFEWRETRRWMLLSILQLQCYFERRKTVERVSYLVFLGVSIRKVRERERAERGGGEGGKGRKVE